MRAAVILFMVLLTMAGCSQPSQAPEQGEKEDVERATEDPVVGAAECSDFASPDEAMDYYTSEASEAEKRALDENQDGFACNESASVASAQSSGSAGSEATSGGPALPSVDASASVDTSRMDNFDCRIQAHALEEGMDAQASTAFGDEMADRLIEDMEAGGNKDVGDILDDMGVPAYEEDCGPPL